jgi:hypothetical protein
MIVRGAPTAGDGSYSLQRCRARAAPEYDAPATIVVRDLRAIFTARSFVKVSQATPQTVVDVAMVAARTTEERNTKSSADEREAIKQDKTWATALLT